MHPSQLAIQHHEEYNNIKTVLQKPDYDSNECIICVDLKWQTFAWPAKRLYQIFMIHPPVGSKARNVQWMKQGWPPTDSMRIGEANIISEPLVA